MQKQIDAVLTEDSDLIAFGCTKIIKGLSKDGTCKLLDLKPGGQSNTTAS